MGNKSFLWTFVGQSAESDVETTLFINCRHIHRIIVCFNTSRSRFSKICRNILKQYYSYDSKYLQLYRPQMQILFYNLHDMNMSLTSVTIIKCSRILNTPHRIGIHMYYMQNFWCHLVVCRHCWYLTDISLNQNTVYILVWVIQGWSCYIIIYF